MYFLILFFLNLFNFQNNSEIISSCDYFEIDHLGNIYVVKNTEIIKYDSQQRKICSFSDNSLGEISTVDTSDPLRILLFYQDFNKLVYLNNRFSKIGNEIDLYNYSANESDLVCNSQKGGFWIYNTIENQLIYINNNGIISTKSILLTNIFANSEIVKIVEKNSKLYLLYINKGVLRLNQNGQFEKKHTINDITDFQIVGGDIIYRNENGLYRYLPFNQEDELILHCIKNELIRCSKAKVYISNKKSISIKSISF